MGDSLRELLQLLREENRREFGEVKVAIRDLTASNRALQIAGAQHETRVQALEDAVIRMASLDVRVHNVEAEIKTVVMRVGLSEGKWAKVWESVGKPLATGVVGAFLMFLASRLLP